MGNKLGFCGLLAQFAESPLSHSTKVGFIPRLFGGSAENTLTDYQLYFASGERPGCLF